MPTTQVPSVPASAESNHGPTSAREYDSLGLCLDRAPGSLFV